MKPILDEPVALSYGARFGPDIADVAEWEERVLALAGTKETTTVTRSTLPSFRTTCVSWPLSTKPDPAGTTWGVQAGSSAMLNVAVPDLTITRLGPGWLCQPNVAPGWIMFCST